MIRYYLSRDLARRLRIPLNRWKRWAREFLPPDPLGGLQSGYARQFSTREAFIVYLGGFLVAGLGFSIPQARQIIRDLSGWMKKSGLDAALMGRGGDGDANGHEDRRYEIQNSGPPGGGGQWKWQVGLSHPGNQPAADGNGRASEPMGRNLYRDYAQVASGFNGWQLSAVALPSGHLRTYRSIHPLDEVELISF